MLALREFRIAKIPREMCAQWFSAWIDRGFNYDISKFTSWNYEVDCIQFDATAFVISVPVHPKLILMLDLNPYIRSYPMTI